MSLTAQAIRKWPFWPGLIDAVCVGVIASGVVGLFVVDIRAPRGMLDGFGYPGIVALSARFGRRAVTVCALLTSVLIVIAPFVIPQQAHTLDLLSRLFALFSIWIVAVVLAQRLDLERYVVGRDTTLALHQQALLDAVHRVLLADMPLQGRIRRLTEIAARAVDVGRVGVFRWREDDTRLVCLDMYRHPENRHEITPDLEENRHPDYLETMHRTLVIVAPDVSKEPCLEIRRERLAQYNVHALLAAGIFLDGRMVGQITFSNLHTPRQWTMQEIAFARSLANIMAILFSADRNGETLAALDLVSEGIYATAETGTILYANRAARAIAATRQSPDGAALPAAAYPHPVSPLEGDTDEHDILFEGAELEIQRTRLPRGGIITRINDVSGRNRAARESARLQKRLQQAAKMEAIGQLAGGIAHDFNNVLSSIMGFARFLEEDLPANSEEQRFAKRILAACDRGKNLVNQILDFALARTARQDPVDLAQAVRQSEEQLLPVMPQNILLETWIADEEAIVVGSAAQLSQVIANLCTNARDAIGNASGKITITLTAAAPAETQRLSIGPNEISSGEFDRNRSYAVLRVSDTGEGISPTNLPRIFEPFFTTKGRQRGTGLGLAVVHGVVAAHHGVCHVRSEPSAGTTVSIYLPLARPAPETMEKSDRHATPGNERVLLVDDEADIVETMSRGLTRMGYRAVGTDDPREVVRAIEKDAGAWDVVITDQIMPGIEGLELIRRLKILCPELLTILCTGYGEEADEQTALAAGADAYVKKPVDAAALAECIRRLRGEQRRKH